MKRLVPIGLIMALAVLSCKKDGDRQQEGYTDGEMESAN